jgi:hypothetical protein
MMMRVFASGIAAALCVALPGYDSMSVVAAEKVVQKRRERRAT